MSLLERLDVSSNELTEILPSTFDQCTRLIELDVSGNRLTNIENVRFPVSMTHLNVRDNIITTLGKNFCQRAPRLERLGFYI